MRGNRGHGFVRLAAISIMAALLILTFAALASAAEPSLADSCATCHGAATASPAPETDFSASTVVRTTACRKCHWEPAGSHPYHLTTWNCGSCHPGWGAIKLSAVPKYYSVPLDAYFNTTTSDSADADTLHAIHSNAGWMSGVTKNGRRCGSCHKPAGCVACHEGSVTPAHEDHSWDTTLAAYLYPPSATSFGLGTTRGNESEDTAHSGVTCSNRVCHDIGSSASLPAVAEEGNASVSFSGTWGRASTSGYSGGAYRMSNAAGARVDFRFSGQKVEWVSDSGSYRGSARVSLDGVEQTVVQLYTPDVRKQVTAFTSGKLASGDHTITVEVTGERLEAARAAYVVVDAFRVYETVPSPRTSCLVCHDGVHAGIHANVTPSCGGVGCHNEVSLDDIHAAQGCACHGSADARVSAAVAARDGDCVACHNAMKVHGAPHEASSAYAASVDFPVGDGFGGITVYNAYTIKCLSCHRTNLLSNHGTDYTNCSMCHASGGPRSSFSTWDKTCQTGVCHPGTRAPHRAPQVAHYHEKMGPGVQPEGMCYSCHGNPEGWQCGSPFGCHTNVVPPATIVDFRAPVTSASRSGADPIVWRLSATDLGDGVVATFYSFDDAPFALYGPAEVANGVTNPADASAPYAHTLRFYSEDAAGNVEAVRTEHYNVTDSTPPVVSFNGVSLGGTSYAAKSLVMSVTDPKVNGLNTGVAFVHTEVSTYKTNWGWFPYQMFYQPLADFSYPLDGDWDSVRTISPLESYVKAKSSPGFWPTYGGTINDGGGGDAWFEIQYYARDFTGNQSVLTYSKLYIDNTAPNTTTSSAGTYRWRLNASDNICGVASTYYAFDGAAFTAYTAADATNGIANTQPGGADPGSHVLTYYSVDKLGNTEILKTLPYTIP